MREEGADDVESIGVDPLDERFAHVGDDHDVGDVMLVMVIAIM